MARATWLLGATWVVAVALCIWLYLDNRSLRAELVRASARSQPAPAVMAARPAEHTGSPARTAAATTPVAAAPAGAAPALPAPPNETEARMERRARRTDEVAALLGRLDGETDDEYRARLLPMFAAGLTVPRLRIEEQRRIAQEKAHVTPDQSAKLDKAFDKVYSDVLDFTNKAVSDGQLSPYERNVSGWLEYAGGLGSILGDANTQIGKILEPSQMRAMYDSGFEWGEYLGLKAPWEQLRPPPPRK
jgi:hypothetical protein